MSDKSAQYLFPKIDCKLFRPCRGCVLENNNPIITDVNFDILFYQSRNPMMIFENDTFRVLEVNESAISFYGYSREEFLNLSNRQLRTESELAAFDKLAPGFLGEGNVTAETKHRTKQGDAVDVSIVYYLITYKNKVCRLAHIHNVSSKVRQDKNLQILLSIGQSISGWAWYFRDITKQQELQKQKDEFISTVSR